MLQVIRLCRVENNRKSNSNHKIHVNPVPVVRIANVALSTKLRFVRALTNTSVHHPIADQNVQSIRNVRRIKHVTNLNVQILVQERVEVDFTNKNSEIFNINALRFFFLFS